MGGREGNQKRYFTLFLSQLKKQKQTGSDNIANEWEKDSHGVKETAYLPEPWLSVTHTAFEAEQLRTTTQV